MKVFSVNKDAAVRDGSSGRGKACASLLSLVIFIALLMQATPALAKSSFSISLHLSDGYYQASSIYYGYSPYLHQHNNHFRGHSYIVPPLRHRGHRHLHKLDHRPRHDFGRHLGHRHKHKFNCRHHSGHLKHRHFRSW
jgi:hypothetical protein